MKLISKSAQAMAKRMVINFFRQIVWLEPKRACLVEVGSADILDKIASLQKEFVAKQEQQTTAIQERKDDATESRKKLEAKLAAMDAEVATLEKESKRIGRVADRYKEMHA